MLNRRYPALHTGLRLSIPAGAAGLEPATPGFGASSCGPFNDRDLAVLKHLEDELQIHSGHLAAAGNDP